ncbi:unnamed protein product [Clonostachys rosea]|uniref:Uncharacterized protein n=1 Tax=Bionectria ochroleuca TaxID=29856 RepID=A0ABY6UNU3_BIOOC|nr:unnamed protein product [Clonostachys rosea]
MRSWFQTALGALRPAAATPAGPARRVAPPGFYDSPPPAYSSPGGSVPEHSWPPSLGDADEPSPPGAFDDPPEMDIDDSIFGSGVGGETLVGSDFPGPSQKLNGGYSQA